MKNIKNTKKTCFIKKVFIKLCRKLGYEIIDQNRFEIPTQNKQISDNLSSLGYNSINLPLGEIKITRKVKALDIIIRTCASVTMLTQNKTRLFEKEKIEYTLRTINSLLNDTIGLPDKEYKAFQEYKEMSDKHTYLFDNHLLYRRYTKIVQMIFYILMI